MTRCPCSRSVCRPNSSFFYKVLSSLKQLQTHKKYGNGASLEDIAKFMDQNYKLNGDIVSQVENALCVAECSRFVIKKKNLYALLCPAAALQFTPDPCVKAKLERIQEVFNSKWYEDKVGKGRSDRNTDRDSYSPPHFISPHEASCPCPPPNSKSDVKNNQSKIILRNRSASKKLCDTSRSSSKKQIRSRSSSKESKTDQKCRLCSPLNTSKRTKRNSSSTKGPSKKKKRRSSRKFSKRKMDRSSTSSENVCYPCTSSNEIIPYYDDSDSDSSEC